MLKFFILFSFSSFFVPIHSAILNPLRLGCERMMGEWGNYDTLFKNAMQIGDKFVTNGIVSPNPGTVRINLAMVNTSSDIAIHMRADINSLSYVIWDAFINGRWTGQEHSPQPFRGGQPYEVVMEYTGSTIEISFNGAHIYSFRLRTPSYYTIGNAQLFGTHTTNYIEMICKNPPATTGRPRTTRRHRPGHGGGGHGGDGHGGAGYGGGGTVYSSSSSGSSSSESCEH